MSRPSRAVFVCTASSFPGSGGGVQICTTEYHDMIKAAGIEVDVHRVPNESQWLWRSIRKVNRKFYQKNWTTTRTREIVEKCKSTRSEYVFLNQVVFAPLAVPLRKALGSQTKIVLLSHGMEATDLLINLESWRHYPELKQSSRNAAHLLGECLLTEREQRLAIDSVFTLSSFEVELERWIGAKEVYWLPRTILPGKQLVWNPIPCRVGFVGTLDHPPNYHGLRLVLDELTMRSKGASFRLRIVGGPNELGQWLQSRYPFIDYLGNLTDAKLEEEATTWCCFLHPLFFWARGCSTKLATALAWRIPVIATPAGCRGYSWKEGSLPIAKSPEEFARMTMEMASPHVASKSLSQLDYVVQSTPVASEVSDYFVHCLKNQNRHHQWMDNHNDRSS